MFADWDVINSLQKLVLIMQVKILVISLVQNASIFCFVTLIKVLFICLMTANVCEKTSIVISSIISQLNVTIDTRFNITINETTRT